MVGTSDWFELAAGEERFVGAVYTSPACSLLVRVERPADLRPAFDRRLGTVTAGNASPLTDGASAVLVFPVDYAMVGAEATGLVLDRLGDGAVALPLSRERPGHPIVLASASAVNAWYRHPADGASTTRSRRYM